MMFTIQSRGCSLNDDPRLCFDIILRVELHSEAGEVLCSTCAAAFARAEA